MCQLQGRTQSCTIVTALHPICFCLQLYGGLPNLMAVRQWVKAQIMNQCQGQLPRLKSDLPPQAWGVHYGGGRGMGGRGRGRGRGGRKRRGDSEDESEPEPEPESDSEPGQLVVA